MSFTASASSYRRVFKDGTPTAYRTSPLSRPSLSRGGLCPSSASPITPRSTGQLLRSSTPRLAYDKVDLSLAESVNQELLTTRSNEKAELQELNERFASFIEKVRYLEQQNAGLQAELSRHQNQQEQSRAGELCQQELCQLRHQLDLVAKERDGLQVQRDNLAEDLTRLNHRLLLDKLQMEMLEGEAMKRAEAENNQVLLRKDVDDATLSRLGLERKIESLMDEIEFLKKVQEEEIHDLQTSKQTQLLHTELDGPARPDLTSALRDIRAQYESIATKNNQEAEEWYKSKFADLTDSARRSMEAMRQAKQDANCSKRHVQTLTCDVDALKSTNEAILRQMREMDKKFTAEAGEYQDTVAQLEDEIHRLKGEMSRHLCEYQDLLNIKMALDIEIATYRKLLEGEESRIAIPVHSFSSLSLRNADLDHPQDVHTRKTMLIKTIEMHDGEVVREPGNERETDRDD